MIAELRTMSSGLTPMRKMYRLPGLVWGTKGFEFWTLLSLLLLRARPKHLLELGSGRSTSILADYANSYGGNLTSLETDEAWYNKASLDIVCLGIRRKQVHLIPLRKPGWYDIDQFRKITKGETGFDFVFVDAPNDARGHSDGYRDDPDGLEEIKACSRECQIMIVDDIHRKHVLDTVDKMLSEPDDFEKYYYKYKVVPDRTNWLCICVRKSSGIPAAVPDIENTVGAILRRDFTYAMCNEP